MDIRHIDESFAVAPQFAPEEMAALAEQGFTAIICNRPDGEEEGQPTVSAMREAAQEAGLAFHHLPTSSGVFPEALIAGFRAVRWGSDGPVLAYCRTGTRSITLEMLANPKARDVAERLKLAQDAGYDLSGMADRLAQ